MSHLTISVLGPFTVELAGTRLPRLSYDKARALLAYLAVERDHPHRREALAGLLWPETPDRSARQSLSQALSTLRTALENAGHPDSLFEATRQTVSLHPDCDLWLDAQAFDACFAAVRTHDHEDVATCEPCLSELARAAELYQGEFLADLSLSDCAPFEEWALLQREQSRRRVLEALDTLAEAALAKQNYGEARHHAHRELALDPWREPAHRQLMRALALDGQRAAALAQFETCREVLRAELDVAPAPATTAVAAAIRDGTLRAGVPATSEQAQSNASTPQVAGPPPFRGLRFFDVDDGDIFFGREALTRRLVRRVTTGEPFLIVIGASGSGKSSLLRAGLIAELQAGAAQGGPKTAIKILTPTAHPLQALCRRLGADDAVDSDVAACRKGLLTDPDALRRRLAEQPSPDAQRLLLVVDQFEELFSLCHDPEVRRAFVTNLVNASGSAKGSLASIQVVLALRADFYHRCAEFPELREILERHQTYIGAMTPEELRRAIERPADLGGWELAPGLVDLLLQDVGADARRTPEPGALPLLSHAMLETWKRREGRMLTLKGYAEAGGVRGAIAHSAESVYRTLNADERMVARDVFLRLTELGETVDDAGTSLFTRRRASLEELSQPSGSQERLTEVLNTLARARLITVEQDAVEVAHEALIREWPTLRSWLEEDLEGLRIHRHLTEAAQAWERHAHDPGDLYRGARLAQAREWAAGRSANLNALEQEFLAAAEVEETRMEEEREAQRRRELAAARRAAEAEQRTAAERGRLLRWIGLAAGLLLVATITATILGGRYRTAAQEKAQLADHNAAIAATAQAAEAQAIAASEQEAQQRAAAEAARQSEAKQRAAAEAAEREAAAQRDAAEAEARANLAMGLAGQAAVHEDDNSALALLLALEANAIQNTPQTKGALLSTLESSPGRVTFLTDNEDGVGAVAVSPDGQFLATADGSRVVLRDARAGTPTGEPLRVPNGWVPQLAFLDGGRVLAAMVVADDNETPLMVRFWELRSQGEIGDELDPLLATDFVGDYPMPMAISPDSRSLVMLGCKETFTVSVGWVYCRESRAVLWDISGLVDGSSDAEPMNSLDFVMDGWRVAFHPDGGTIAIVGCEEFRNSDCEQGFTLFWSPDTGEVTKLPQEAQTQTGMTLVENLAFTSDGAYLATAGCGARAVNSTCAQSRADLWDLAALESIAEYTEVGPGFSALAVSPDDRTVALGGKAAMLLWTPMERALGDRPLVGHVGSVHGLAFAPDGQTLYSGAEDRTIGVWDLTLRGGIRSRLTREWEPVSQTSFDPTGSLLVAGGQGRAILWDAEAGELVGTLPLDDPNEALYGATFSPDGTLIATASLTKQEVRLWNAQTRTPVGVPVVPQPRDPVVNAVFSPDGDLLASSCMNNPTITLLEVSSILAGAPVSRTLVGHEPEHGIPQLVFSPDGVLLASAGFDGKVLLWDVASGVQVGDPLSPTGGEVYSVAFSPNGAMLASVGADPTVRLWDVATHKLVAQLPGHDFGVWRLGFTPDGQMLLSIDYAGHLRFWDMSDPDRPGRAIGETMKAHLDGAYGLTISPDGKTAITTAQSGEVQRWHIDPAWWRERACAIAGRNLTQTEWAQYLSGEDYHLTCPQWPAGE